MGPQTFIFGQGSKKCYRLTKDLPKRFLINYKLKSAPIIFLNMVFLTNSSDGLILFLIMMYHFFLLKKTKSKGMEIFILFCILCEKIKYLFSWKLLVFFRIQEGGFDKGKGKFRGFDTPVGAMLWAIRNRVLCVMVKYYVHISDPVIKLLVSVIEWSNIIWIYQENHQKNDDY